jgi:hypothetical protein
VVDELAPVLAALLEVESPLVVPVVPVSLLQPNAVVPASAAPNASIAVRLIPRGGSAGCGGAALSAVPQNGHSVELARTCL